MILITGGLGFIGTHTARALLDCGESCILTSHRSRNCPDFLRGEIGRRIVVEPLDCADRSSVLDIGRRHPITGIVHLAAAGGTGGLLCEIRADTLALLNVLEAARQWGASRVAIASTFGVYLGVATGPLRETLPLSMDEPATIPAIKKSAELLAGVIGTQDELDVVLLRFSTIWGPLIRNLEPVVPRLVHQAVRGADAARPAGQPLYANDVANLCFVKDCARAVALLQLADRLPHRTYNVAGGAVSPTRDVVAAIEARLPGARLELRSGRGPVTTSLDHPVDISRLVQDTGYAPEYDLERGVAEYVDWLEAGHEY